MGRSPGDVDELAHAARGLRVTRVDEAKNGILRVESAANPSGAKAVRDLGTIK
jgi:hypothetical protein